MRAGKRALDLALGGIATVLAAPLFLVVAVLVKAGDGGPVFFRQTRVGRNGVPFRIWKFRTMVQGAEARGSQLTVAMDPRITWAGQWLRRSRFDELPQLFNVLAGEMTLVGPRPEVPRFVALYDADQRRVLELTPGVTDPASLAYRNEASLLAGAPDPERLYAERIMPQKVRMSLEYADRATLWSDLQLIAGTLGTLFGAGSASPPHLDRPFPGAH